MVLASWLITYSVIISHFQLLHDDVCQYARWRCCGVLWGTDRYE